MILITRRQKQLPRKQMVYVSVSTRRFCRSSIKPTDRKICLSFPPNQTKYSFSIVCLYAQSATRCERCRSVRKPNWEISWVISRSCKWLRLRQTWYGSYSAEFKQQIVQACKASDVSIASVALQHGLDTNLVSKWIRLFDGKPKNDRSPLPNKPAFIALSCSAPLDPISTNMLTVQITLPHSKAEIGLK